MIINIEIYNLYMQYRTTYSKTPRLPPINARWMRRTNLKFRLNEVAPDDVSLHLSASVLDRNATIYM